jgi:hypothetical protein
MQAGQVSVWIPIIVGFLGVVGVVAGQLVNAWREDRRWKRELEREDIRWTREASRSLEQHRLESSLRTRELRLQTYSELLVVMTKIESNLMSNIHTPAGMDDELQRLHSQNRSLVDKAAQLLAKIQLISTEAVVHSATVLKENIEPKTYQLMRMRRDDKGVAAMDGENEAEIYSEVFHYFSECQEDFTRKAQVELETVIQPSMDAH